MSCPYRSDDWFDDDNRKYEEEAGDSAIPENITGIENIYGGKDYYDSNGHKVGYSMPGLVGMEYYDSEGRNVGNSIPNMFTGDTFYDGNGLKTGYSSPDIVGYNYYDSKDRKVGNSAPGLSGENYHFGKTDDHNSQNQGRKNRDSAWNTAWEVIGIVVGIVAFMFLLGWLL